MVAVSLFSLNYLVFDVMCITVLHVYTYVLISIIIIGNKLDEHKPMRLKQHLGVPSTHITGSEDYHRVLSINYREMSTSPSNKW